MRSMTYEGEPLTSGFSLIRPAYAGHLLPREKEDTASRIAYVRPMSPALIEWIGALAATLTTTAFLPQAFRTLQTRQTRDISFWTQFLLFTGNMMWLAYGLFIGSWPLILANMIGVPLIGAVLFLKIRHG
jgi:MtN3 and saliva related transmembrane protein